MTIDTDTFVSPAASSAPTPVFATAAPARPPIRACDELDGIPTHQVTRSQTMAPARAARTTAPSTRCGSTMPVPIVAATCSPKNKKATKLKNAAHTTAHRGESTRVETTVAIELAASWNPLTKSNTSATTTTVATRSIDRAQACSSTTPSIVLATSSHRSVALSSAS